MTLTQAVKRQRIEAAKDRVVEAARGLAEHLSRMEGGRWLNNHDGEALQGALRDLAELEKE